MGKVTNKEKPAKKPKPSDTTDSEADLTVDESNVVKAPSPPTAPAAKQAEKKTDRQT